MQLVLSRQSYRSQQLRSHPPYTPFEVGRARDRYSVAQQPRNSEIGKKCSSVLRDQYVVLKSTGIVAASIVDDESGLMVSTHPFEVPMNDFTAMKIDQS